MASSPRVATSLSGTAGRRRRESLVRAIFLAAALVSVVLSGFIVYTLVFRAVEYLTIIDLGQLIADGWFPRRGQFDLLTLLLGSGMVAVIAMLIATPVGLGAAVYLSEYASPRSRRWIKPVLEILAGIPSVVLGFFALTFINPTVIQAIFDDATGFNLLAAGVGVGILTIPLVASISEDAMRAVPNALREASYGLGARRISTSIRVVFPAAISGIVAALIIALSRAIGETMIVAIAAGGVGGSLRTIDPLGPGQTLTAAMAAIASGSDQVRGNEGAYESLFFLGLVLFVITFGLNLIGDAFVRRTRQRY
ncbi:MAG TPA: phosphate ABC transporter permease subunit PstC [Candidatus Limnocylindrales bacterium]|nr:phosphate ABC transporter permease subunit PstC [Candidatus Limnocylindrales bacterium]